MAKLDDSCYMETMPQTAKDILSRIAAWPLEDQEELAEIAQEIEARRSGLYVVNEEEAAAIREGLAELDRGEWVDERR
jgi:hypothetical protein